jgi:hypothetical protein
MQLFVMRYTYHHQPGIVNILTNATNGIGIILEHRYYGKSLPSQHHLPNLSTSNLQYLTNEQAELDSIRFIENLNLTHLNIHDSLHPTNRPWIYYGGSYAGARAAHLRKGWPNIVYGAIASSAVTHAQIDYWEYFDAIRQWAPEKCMRVMEETIEAIDEAIDVLEPIGLRKKFQGLFGLEGLEHVDDFGQVLASALDSWQGRNWDPKGEWTTIDWCRSLYADLGYNKFGEKKKTQSDHPSSIDSAIFSQLAVLHP